MHGKKISDTVIERPSVVNSELWFAEPRVVIGAMSGTSLDGIDACALRFSRSNGSFGFECIGSASIQFSPEQKLFFRRLIDEVIAINEVNDAIIYLMHLYADVIELTLRNAGLKSSDVDAIGIHGQTVWHQPNPHRVFDRVISASLQLCSAPTLAQITRIPVVSNFRAADVVLGGQGAPLVPIFDYEFLRSDNEDVVALNIGGMANVTLLSKGCTEENLVAFDTGPGNVWIDEFVQTRYYKNYDEGGAIASSGAMDMTLFSRLKLIPFVIEKPPKSTGRELFNRKILEDILAESASTDVNADIVRTLSEFTAWSIVENIHAANFKADRIVVSGGGSRNAFLMERLNHYIQHSTIIRSNEVGINSELKEAMAFAFLAYRTMGSLHSNVPSVTGAKRRAILGEIAFV